MTPELLAATAGMVLSLAMSYVPGLSTDYDRLSTTGKQLVMGVLLLVTAAGAVLWACGQAENQTLQICVALSWRSYLQSFVSALVANQATHRISPDPQK